MELVGIDSGEGGNIIRENEVQVSELCLLFYCSDKKGDVGGSRFIFYKIIGRFQLTVVISVPLNMLIFS